RAAPPPPTPPGAPWRPAPRPPASPSPPLAPVTTATRPDWSGMSAAVQRICVSVTASSRSSYPGTGDPAGALQQVLLAVAGVVVGPGAGRRGATDRLVVVEGRLDHALAAGQAG